MRYLALATDYDGTIAYNGRVDEPTLEALGRLRDSGRRLILVTGRELDELLAVFPRVDLFERVVAENGALLYRPASREEKLLGEPLPPALIESIRQRGVGPISVGRVIVATWEPHQAAVLEAIRELGLELQVIFNKGAVMVLPSGVNKATGLAVALGELSLSPHNTVGIGDAENDHAFLSLCEFSVAVANALPMLKERADLVTAGDHGRGVIELIDQILADDLKECSQQRIKRTIPLGSRDDGSDQTIDSYGVNILVAGPSATGKSTTATGLLEGLADAEYQFLIVDPEGDFSTLECAVVTGGPQQHPTVEAVLELLESPRQNVVANLNGLPIEQRPAFFDGLLPRVQALRARTGRPHWIVVDEAHHLLPATWAPTTLTLPQRLEGILLITVHPDSVAKAILNSIDLILAVGAAADQTIEAYCKAVLEPAPAAPPTPLEPGEVFLWRRGTAEPPVRVRCFPSRSQRRRHSRKYAEGNLGPDRSFHFRGPEGKLNLRAQNLNLFLQIADGVDDATWMYHLRQGDYSHWFLRRIKDEDLARETEQVEREPDASPRISRAAIRALVEARYTLPSEPAELAAPRASDPQISEAEGTAG